MLIFDGDYPMAYGALELNRDLTLPIDEVRAAEERPDNIPFASLPEMRRGRIAAALVKFTVRRQRPGSVLPGLRGAEAIYGAARGQLAYYEMLAECGQARLLTRGADLAAHIAEWEKAQDTTALPVGFVVGMEGADPILSPAQVQVWWQCGVRVVSLTHYGPSSYAHGTGSAGGLLGSAVDLLKEMEACGMLLDLTHIADESFWQAVDLYEGPVLASHQNCRALVPGERQFSDEQLQIIIERSGVIGVSMDTWMLHAPPVLDWARTGAFKRRDHFARADISLQHVADHVDYICQLSGNSLHAAIGGDTDGQGGVDGAPAEVDTVADYQKLAPVLAARGYGESDIENVMYKNWLRFYEKHLPDYS
jgi:membrane dipeptidase